MTEPMTTIGVDVPTDLLPRIYASLRSRYGGADRETLTDEELAEFVLVHWLTATLADHEAGEVPKERDPESGELTEKYRKELEKAVERARKDAEKLVKKSGKKDKDDAEAPAPADDTKEKKVKAK